MDDYSSTPDENGIRAAIHELSEARLGLPESGDEFLLPSPREAAVRLLWARGLRLFEARTALRIL